MEENNCQLEGKETEREGQREAEAEAEEKRPRQLMFTSESFRCRLATSEK